MEVPSFAAFPAKDEGLRIKTFASCYVDRGS